MNQNRRNFIMNTGAVCALAMTGRRTGAVPAHLAETEPAATKERGMAHGLTVLNIRRGSEYRLGVKNEKGVLDVVEAAGELGPVLQGLEVRLRVRIVARGVRPTVRLGDAERPRRRHRWVGMGVHALWQRFDRAAQNCPGRRERC